MQLVSANRITAAAVLGWLGTRSVLQWVRFVRWPVPQCCSIASWLGHAQIIITASMCASHRVLN